jgi:hypothetical protein
MKGKMKVEFLLSAINYFEEGSTVSGTIFMRSGDPLFA